MGVFGNEDYVDYTLLKKRGLLKENNQEIKNESSNSGFVDFTAGFNSANSNVNSSPQASTGNPFDLLSNLTSSSSSVSSTYPNNSSSSEEVNALKLKIEDLEYKLQRLIERIDGMNLSK